MDNLLAVIFEAHHAEKNHHRRYSLRIGRDLLDDWTLTIGHGRTGQAGQETRFASPLAEEIQAIVRERLRRRLSACSYRLVGLDASGDLDIATWLPDNLMTSFEAADRIDAGSAIARALLDCSEGD